MVDLAREISNKTSPPLIMKSFQAQLRQLYWLNWLLQSIQLCEQKVKCFSYYNIILIKNAICFLYQSLLNYTLNIVDLAREISKSTPDHEKLLSSVETTLLTHLTFMIDTTLWRKSKMLFIL